MSTRSNIFHCLNKTDIFTVLNFEKPEYNPPHINLYTAERIYTGKYQYDANQRFNARSVAQEENPKDKDEMHYMTHYITADLNSNWAVSVGDNKDKASAAGRPQFHVYKFFPSTSSTYNYVAPCANRGICDGTSGLCKCFPGYTSDNCHEQNSLSV